MIFYPYFIFIKNSLKIRRFNFKLQAYEWVGTYIVGTFIRLYIFIIYRYLLYKIKLRKK